MESTASRLSAGVGALSVRRVALPAFAAWLLSFALITYLGLRGGGYDLVVRNEVGIAVWWLVVVALLAGVARDARTTTVAGVAWCALAGLCLWTALSLGWTESSERTTAELSRVAAYTGIFALGLLAVARAGARPVLNGAFCAIAVVAGIALVSRLEPSSISAASETGRFLPSVANRLAYPLNYWNALGALVAMGLPLALWIAYDGRTVVGRAAAGATIPPLCLVLFLTFSRGGTGALIVGALVTLALSRGRAWHALTLSAGGCGGAILVAAAADRPGIEDGLRTAAAESQGDELMAYVVVVMAGAALLQVAISLAERHGIPPRLAESIQRRRGALALVLISAAAAFAVAIGIPGEINDRWQEFKHPTLGLPEAENNRIQRFQSASGNGRYQYWQEALDAATAKPVGGIGAGTFEFWWARNGNISGFIRDAHSLYFETLAELGLVGLILLAGFLLTSLIAGGFRAVRGSPLTAPATAAATAGIAAFMISASVDWVWEVAVLPAILLLLISVALGARHTTAREAALEIGPPPRRARKAAVLVAGVAGLVGLVIPLTATGEVRRSQEEARADELGQALSHADRARQLAPFAATPDLQRALVLEATGDLPAAAAAARAATAAESTNWRTWLTLARIESFRGNTDAALRAYDRARALNPRSPLFADD